MGHQYTALDKFSERLTDSQNTNFKVCKTGTLNSATVPHVIDNHTPNNENNSLIFA